MIRVTIDILPGGNEKLARTIGMIEIANRGLVVDGRSDYDIVLKMTPPFKGSLQARWRAGRFSDDDEVTVGEVLGFHRARRGIYDLLFRGLEACGLAERDVGGRGT